MYKRNDTFPYFPNKYLFSVCVNTYSSLFLKQPEIECKLLDGNITHCIWNIEGWINIQQIDDNH